MPDNRRQTESYVNPNYCLARFLDVMRLNSLFDDGDEAELKELIFGGSRYIFPYCYDGNGDQFSPYSVKGKYNRFCDLASSMVYVKKSVGDEDGKKTKSCPLNGNSLAALVGRFITQYYVDRFGLYEKFFDGLVKAGKIIDTGAIIKELSGISDINIRQGADDVKKLVVYTVCAFYTDNAVTYNADAEEYTNEKPPLSLKTKGVRDIFWQIANSDPEESCSKFARDFVPRQYHVWVKSNWPVSEYVTSDAEYRVADAVNSEPRNIMWEKDPMRVPDWLSLDDLIRKLSNLYLVSEKNTVRGSFAGDEKRREPHGQQREESRSRGEGVNKQRKLSDDLEYIRTLTPEERKSYLDQLSGIIFALNEMEKDFTKDERTNDTGTDSGAEREMDDDIGYSTVSNQENLNQL